MLNEIPAETVSEVDDVLRTLGHHSRMPTILLTKMDDKTWSVMAARDEADFGFFVGQEVERSHTLCNLVRETGGALAVDDARRDERVRDHPACREFGIVSYLGVPFRLPDGSVVGTLCAVDRAPHLGLDADVRLYSVFAHLLAHEFDLANAARLSLAALNSARENGMSRERFLAAVAHDLRTPLAAIEACAQLVQRAHDGARDQQWAARILASAHRMGRLIDDLLDLVRGRLGSGIPVQRRPLSDVKAFLEDVTSELATAHPGRVHADIRVELETASWDRDRVAQCLDNIITNACVHGTGGLPVTITARGTHTMVTVDVVNAGEIPPNDRTTLFDPFHGTSMRSRGLGLGLFIAEQIARAHGGGIEVDSVAGETRTRILLPLA